MTSREPRLEPVPIAQLRPTQITVGFREVAEKRHHWRKVAPRNAPEFLRRHIVPVIRGPKERHYLIDHHHLARALHDEGVEQVLVTVVADLRAVHKDSFWVVLDDRRWCHPYDAKGRRCGFEEIPPSIADLEDDPFRSLAGELRRAGGYAKDITPYSEFLWADFLRRQLKRKDIAKDFNAALRKALKLAKGEAAAYLPGWCGKVKE
jgi:hypothetical protein